MARYLKHPQRRPVFVTGASSGVGQEVARRYSAGGHPIAIAARREQRLVDLKAELEDAGGEVCTIAMDLADGASIDNAVELATTELGEIDIVAHCAGDVYPYSTVGAAPDEFMKSIQVNLGGAQRLVNRIVPDMVNRGRGDIVFIGSETAVRPRPRMAAYVAAKSGLEGMAAALNLELEGTGIRVAVVRPGPISTEQGSNWDADAMMKVLDDWTHHGFLRHAGTLRPREVAAAVHFMTSLPKGTVIPILEIQPEAPLADDRKAD